MSVIPQIRFLWLSFLFRPHPSQFSPFQTAPSSAHNVEASHHKSHWNLAIYLLQVFAIEQTKVGWLWLSSSLEQDALKNAEGKYCKPGLDYDHYLSKTWLDQHEICRRQQRSHHHRCRFWWSFDFGDLCRGATTTTHLNNYSFLNIV